jgi:hypothetical protein
LACFGTFPNLNDPEGPLPGQFAENMPEESAAEKVGCTSDLVNDVLLRTDTKSQQYPAKSPKTCGNEHRSRYRRALLHRWYKAARLLGCARSVRHRRPRPEGLWCLDIPRSGARATHRHRPKAESVKRIAALAVVALSIALEFVLWPKRPQSASRSVAGCPKLPAWTTSARAGLRLSSYMFGTDTPLTPGNGAIF